MKNTRSLIIVAVVVAVLVAAGVAALLIPSNEDDTDADVTPVESAPPALAVGETLPVEVSGDALPPLEGGADAAVGQSMPVISGRSFDGSALTVGGTTDGPTMYVFLAHWCPHCNDEIPELIALNAQGGIPADLDVVGISTAVVADRPNYPPSQWIADKGWPWPVMADDDLATAFTASGGSGFPYTVLADADGTVLARASGSRPADVIRGWLEANLATA